MVAMKLPGELSRVPVARLATPSSEIRLSVWTQESVHYKTSQMDIVSLITAKSAKWTRAFFLHPVHNSFRYMSKTLLTIIPAEVLPQMTTATYSQFIFTHFSIRHCYFLLYCQSLWTYSTHSRASSSHFLGTVTVHVVIQREQCSQPHKWGSWRGRSDQTRASEWQTWGCTSLQGHGHIL